MANRATATPPRAATAPAPTWRAALSVGTGVGVPLVSAGPPLVEEPSSSAALVVTAMVVEGLFEVSAFSVGVVITVLEAVPVCLVLVADSVAAPLELSLSSPSSSLSSSLSSPPTFLMVKGCDHWRIDSSSEPLMRMPYCFLSPSLELTSHEYLRSELSTPAARMKC